MPRPDDDEAPPLERDEGAPRAERKGQARDPGPDGDETLLSDHAFSGRQATIRHIGRYRLTSELGDGGRAAVHLAEDARIRRRSS